MAEQALDTLLSMVRNPKLSMRNRLNAAISASRVSPLSMPGESEPEAIAFLRHVIDYKEPDGTQYSPSFRRESAAALAYWQRRAKKAELQYSVQDLSERRESWRKLINGGIRLHLSKHGRWPRDKHVMLGPGDDFEIPAVDPDRTLAALLFPPANRRGRRRQRAIDERIVATSGPATEEERVELLRPLARAVRQRLSQFEPAG